VIAPPAPRRIDPVECAEHAMQAPSLSSVQEALSLLLIVTGCLLMAGKIHADSEPGAIPLLMVAAGIAWQLVLRLRSRAR
jgi:hypothetical protein